MDPARRAALRGARPRDRRRRASRRPGRRHARLGRRLSAADRPGVGRVRRSGRRLSSGARDQRRADVARGSAGVPARPPVRGTDGIAARRRRIGAHSDAGPDVGRDDRERRLPGVPARAVAPGPCGSDSDGPWSARHARSPWSAHADPGAGSGSAAGVLRRGRAVRTRSAAGNAGLVRPTPRSDGCVDRPRCRSSAPAHSRRRGRRRMVGQRSGTLQYVRVRRGAAPAAVPDRRPSPVRRRLAGAGDGDDGGDRSRTTRCGVPPTVLHVALPTVGAVLGSAISVSSTYVIDGSQEINERYVMYLAPILLVGLAVWIDAGLPRPRWVLGVVLGCVLLGALLPFDRLEVDARYYAPRLPLGRALGSWATPGDPRGSLRARRGARMASLLARPVRRPLGGNACRDGSSRSGHGHGVREPSRDGERRVRRDPSTWVDDAVPEGERVTVVWEHGRDQPETEPVGWISRTDYQLMLTEFFNPSIGPVYRLDAPTITENHLPTRGARVDDSGTLVAEDGSPVSAGVVLTPCHLGVEGRRLASPPTERSCSRR